MPMDTSGPFLRVEFAVDKATWCERIGAVSRLLEHEFPGNPLDCALMPQGASFARRQIADRDKFLRARCKTQLHRFSVDNHNACVAAGGKIGPLYAGPMGLGGSVISQG